VPGGRGEMGTKGGPDASRTTLPVPTAYIWLGAQGRFSRSADGDICVWRALHHLSFFFFCSKTANLKKLVVALSRDADGAATRRRLHENREGGLSC